MIFRGMAALAAAAGFILSGCANDGTLSTAAITPKATTTAANGIDPQCATLASQIDTLRKEGTVERLEKAATGKGSSVQVKRDALAKQAELNKANADFQAKCGPKIPATTAQAAPAPAPTATTTTAAAAAPKAAAAAPTTPPAAQATTAAAKAVAKEATKQQ